MMKPQTPKKIFIICTTDSMITSFLLPYIELFHSKGYEVRCFCSQTGDYFDELVNAGVDMTALPFTRNPLSSGNWRAYQQLKSIVKQDRADLIFCHEPVGGVMGRLAGRLSKTPVIYMAHGFHFFKGAPLKNWLFFYPIEKAMSYFTDMLVTINTEDYRFASRHLKAKRTEYLPGVGVDISKYSAARYDRQAKRKALGFADDDIVLISVGELNENKNHIVILEAMKQCDNEKLHFVIAGVGETEPLLLQKAEEYGLSDRLHLLGYRSDCNELYAASDVFCFPSYREGLSVALMEAMASGLPVIASAIRGNTDLITEDGGILLSPEDVNGFADAIKTMLDADYRRHCGSCNRQRVEDFSLTSVLPQFSQLSETLL